MPSATTEFTLARKQDEVWDLLIDPFRFGRCIPGCEDVTVLTPTESRWKVKISTGIISKRFLINAHIEEQVPRSRLKIRIASQEGDLKGIFTVTIIGETSSSIVKVDTEIATTGQYQWLVNQIINTRLEWFVKEFVNCVSAK